MKKNIFVLLSVLLLAACQQKPVVVNAGDFEEKAPALVDQNVVLKGTAVHVCEKSGMKLFVAENLDSENAVVVFAAEGAEPFAMETIGKNVTVNGVVRAFNPEPAACCEKEADECCEATDSVCAEAAEECCQDSAAAEACCDKAEGECQHEAAANTIYYMECVSYTVE